MWNLNPESLDQPPLQGPSNRRWPFYVSWFLWSNEFITGTQLFPPKWLIFKWTSLNCVFFSTGSACYDIPTPDDAWVQRNGNTLTIRCEETDETWYLTCRDNRWVGKYGECGAECAECDSCPNVPAPRGAWVKRTGFSLTTRCDRTREEWGNVCMNGEWMVEYRECGKGYSIYSIWDSEGAEWKNVASPSHIFSFCCHIPDFCLEGYYLY